MAKLCAPRTNQSNAAVDPVADAVAEETAVDIVDAVTAREAVEDEDVAKVVAEEAIIVVQIVLEADAVAHAEALPTSTSLIQVRSQAWAHRYTSFDSNRTRTS